tara:strand:+ start:72 stop:383 length:312 start_codon:yes stop_codon:yes gene_type:complete
MDSSDLLIKAFLNRAKAKITEKAIDLASQLHKKSKDIPENLQSEWELFKEEVKSEVERLEEERSQPNKKESSDDYQKKELIQNKIDELRDKINILNKKFEELN